MADTNEKTPENQANAQQNQPMFEVLRIYAKDCSLETPNTPAVFKMAWKPEISVEFDAKPTSLGDDQFEIDLRVTATCKIEDKIAFIAEVHQAGIFLVKNVDDATAHYLLGAVAPNTLFPYAREHIASLVNRATFPALNLRPLNFEALYRARQAEAAQKAKEEAVKKEGATQQ
ncbi:MAG: protein-export chaperone SecB [Aeromonadales bacterium]|nr:protein-export chaperone SecB [Aeromonadales bacterium]MDY2891355.1 protein-export chaperone SecB [Succinivibrio sp.]